MTRTAFSGEIGVYGGQGIRPIFGSRAAPIPYGPFAEIVAAAEGGGWDHAIHPRCWVEHGFAAKEPRGGESPEPLCEAARLGRFDRSSLVRIVGSRLETLASIGGGVPEGRSGR